MRRTPPISCLVLLLGAASVGCGRSAPEHSAPPQPPDGEAVFAANAPQLAYISVEPARRRTGRVVATLPAQIVVDEDRTVRIASPVSGRITRLLAQPGDHVTRGQPLAVLTSSDAAQTASDLGRARAAATLAATALRRAEDLYAHHVIALKDLEQARSDDAQARAELARASAHEAQLGAPTGTGTYLLRAPMSGEVLERTVNPGAEIRPDATAPLFTISDIDVVWLSSAATQRDMSAIRRGEQITFTSDAAPGRVFTGTVSYVSDALDPDTRTLTVRAVLPNSGHPLRPSVFGQARVFAPDADSLPAIPTAALVTHGAGTVVYVERTPGHFVRRNVVVADDDGTTATIASGLQLGERVVTRGSILVAGEADASGQ